MGSFWEHRKVHRSEIQKGHIQLPSTRCSVLHLCWSEGKKQTGCIDNDGLLRELEMFNEKEPKQPIPFNPACARTANNSKEKTCKEIISPRGNAVHNMHVRGAQSTAEVSWKRRIKCGWSCLSSILQLQRRKGHSQCRWRQRYLKSPALSLWDLHQQNYVHIHTTTRNCTFPEWSAHYYTSAKHGFTRFYKWS